METKGTLITISTPDSRPESKRVQFSGSRNDYELSSRGVSRETSSARSRSSSRRSRKQLSEGLLSGTRFDNALSPNQNQNNMIMRLALRSRDSRGSNRPSKCFSKQSYQTRHNSVKSFESSLSVARKERDAKFKFKLKMWTHALIYLTRLHQKIINDNQELEPYRKQMDYTEGNFVSSDENNVHVGLDIDYFKPVTKIRMSKEAKRILMKDPDARTYEEIKQVKTDLMVTKTSMIQTLPEDCQLRLARNVGLECLGPKRFIIKEGSCAEYCYLIIVGSVIRASIDEATSKAVSDDKPLREGQLFGQDEMDASSPRKASYISASYTEILRVTSEDYHDIFIAGHNVRSEDINILRQIDIFDGWNLENYQKDRDRIRRKYFPNNWLIQENQNNFEETQQKKTQDSRTFEWIYVVKSGSLQIMKLFPKIKPAINMATGEYSHKKQSDDFLAFLTKEAGYDRQHSRPATANSDKSLPDDLRAAPILRRLDRLLRPHTTGNQERLMNTPDSLRSKKIPASAISSKLVSIPKRRRQSFHNIQKDKQSPADTPETNREDSTLTDISDQIELGHKMLDSRLEKTSSSNIKEGFNSRLEKSPSWDDSEPRQLESRRKHVTINNMHIRDDSPEAEETVLCKIKTLTKGDVFGLEYIVFDEMDEKNQPGFLLKSNGSECLMIHKKVYRDLIKDNFDLKEKLRSDISPYPEDVDLKENFNLRIHWELHKKIFIKNIMAEKARQRPQKHGKKYAPFRLK